MSTIMRRRIRKECFEMTNGALASKIIDLIGTSNQKKEIEFMSLALTSKEVLVDVYYELYTNPDYRTWEALIAVTKNELQLNCKR